MAHNTAICHKGLNSDFEPLVTAGVIQPPECAQIRADAPRCVDFNPHYAMGQGGSSTCPSGYYQIMSEAECSASEVGKMVSRTYTGSFCNPQLGPKGCAMNTGHTLWPAIAGPGKVCTPGDTVNGKFDPALNVKPSQFACQEWAVSRGRSVYVWGTNNGCQSCGTTNTRDGWGGYSVYQEPSSPTGTEMWFMNCDADTDASHHAPVCKRDWGPPSSAPTMTS